MKSRFDPILARVRRAFFRRAAVVPALDARVLDEPVVVRLFVEGDPPPELPLACNELPGLAFEIVQADDSWECLFGAQCLMLGPVTFEFVRKDSAELRAELATKALAAARLLDNVEMIGPGASAMRVQKLVRDAATAMTDSYGFVPVRLEDDTVRISRGYYGWISSYELGTVDSLIASVPVEYLPRDRALMMRFLREVEALASILGVSETPSEYVCQFCAQTFPGLHFHAHLGACHGCAESKLGIVH
jgi:hypothetical protein